MTNLNRYTIIEKFIAGSERIIEKQTIPLYDLYAFASISSQFVDGHIEVEEITVLETPKADGAIRVTGNSMYPMIMKGDIVTYETIMNRRGGLFFGHIYILSFELDGEAYTVIKRIYQSDTLGHYKLVSDNPEHKPVEIPASSVHRLARIKSTWRPNVQM